MEQAGGGSAHDLIRSFLKPMGKRKNTVYDVIAHGTGWNTIMGYTNQLGLEHTVYKNWEDSFCYDVRSETETLQGDYKGFPNMGRSESLYGLFNVIVERYTKLLSEQQSQAAAGEANTARSQSTVRPASPVTVTYTDPKPPGNVSTATRTTVSSGWRSPM